MRMEISRNTSIFALAILPLVSAISMVWIDIKETRLHKRQLYSTILKTNPDDQES